MHAERSRREGKCGAEIKEDKGRYTIEQGCEGGSSPRKKVELRTELGTGLAACGLELREGAGMSGAADAPASSPPQQRAGSREGREHQPPLPFFGICLSATLSNFLCLSSSSRGERETSPLFPPSAACTSQVQAEEIGLSSEGRASAAQSLSHHIVEVPVTRSPASATPCALCPRQDLERWVGRGWR